jgi:hypothetical protein
MFFEQKKEEKEGRKELKIKIEQFQSRGAVYGPNIFLVFSIEVINVGWFLLHSN